MFHGSGSDAAAFNSEGSMATKASKQGYLLAYLEALPHDGYDREWDTGSASGLDDWERVDDVGFSAEVVADLTRKYNIDKRRVYTVGISNGASMAIRVACEHPELIAGVASVHGSLESRKGDRCAKNCRPHGACDWDDENEDCKMDTWEDNLEPVFSCGGIKENKVAVFLLNGNRDWYTSRDGEVWVSNATYNERHIKLAPGLENRLKPYSYPPRSFMYESFARAAGCSDREEVSFFNGTGDDTTQCTTVFGCASNLTTCVSKAGHWWYGAPYDVTTPCLYKGYGEESCTERSQFWDYGRFTQSIDATNEILTFLGNYQKD